MRKLWIGADHHGFLYILTGQNLGLPNLFLRADQIVYGVMVLFPDNLQGLEPRLQEVVVRPQIIPPDIILDDRVNGGITFLALKGAVLDKHGVECALTDFVELQVVLGGGEHRQFWIIMPLPDFLLEHAVLKAELNEFEFVHQLWVLEDVLDDVFLVLVDFQLLNDAEKFL